MSYHEHGQAGTAAGAWHTVDDTAWLAIYKTARHAIDNTAWQNIDTTVRHTIDFTAGH